MLGDVCISRAGLAAAFDERLAVSEQKTIYIVSTVSVCLGSRIIMLSGHFFPGWISYIINTGL